MIPAPAAAATLTAEKIHFPQPSFFFVYAINNQFIMMQWSSGVISAFYAIKNFVLLYFWLCVDSCQISPKDGLMLRILEPVSLTGLAGCER